MAKKFSARRGANRIADAAERGVKAQVKAELVKAGVKVEDAGPQLVVKPARPEQAHLPGMEPVRNAEIERLAIRHAEAKDEAKDAKETMEGLELKLGQLLEANNLPAYNLNGVMVVRADSHKIKVTVKPRAKGEL